MFTGWKRRPRRARWQPCSGGRWLWSWAASADVTGASRASADVTSVAGRAWGDSRTVAVLGAVPLPAGLVSFAPTVDVTLQPNGTGDSRTNPTGGSAPGYATGALATN